MAVNDWLPDGFWDNCEAPEPTKFWPHSHPNGPNLNGDEYEASPRLRAAANFAMLYGGGGPTTPTTSPTGRVTSWEPVYHHTPKPIATLPKGHKAGLVPVGLQTPFSGTIENIWVSQTLLDPIRAQSEPPVG